MPLVNDTTMKYEETRAVSGSRWTPTEMLLAEAMLIVVQEGALHRCSDELVTWWEDYQDTTRKVALDKLTPAEMAILGISHLQAEPAPGRPKKGSKR